MPNYCQCELYFNQSDALKAVLEFMGEGFDFNKLIPYPEQYAARDADAQAIRAKYNKRWDERTQADRDAEQADWQAFVEKYGNASDGFNSGGIDWCRENWGTKWNACDARVEGNHLVFETAWGPPEPVIISIAKHFPQYTLYFEYFEQGMSYCGGFTLPNEDDYYGNEPWQPGVVTHEWYAEGYRGHKGG